MEVPPGHYHIEAFISQFQSYRQNIYTLPGKPPSTARVGAGEMVYVGAINFTTTYRKVNWEFFSHFPKSLGVAAADEYDRDIPILRKKYPKIEFTDVRKSVFDGFGAYKHGLGF